MAGLVCWYLLTLDSHASLLLLLFPPVYREGGGPFTLGDYAVGDASFEALLDQLAGLYTPAASPAAAAAVEALPRLPVPPAPGGPDAPEPHEVYAVVTPGEACPVCHDEMAPGALVVQLPCSHCFHEPCLLPWLDTVRDGPGKGGWCGGREGG